jgi:4-diphosphocytidyl-2-C-methyl-D-erythritol kinase
MARVTVTVQKSGKVIRQEDDEMKIEKRAYGKINLGLDVTGKREDGYHLVKMVMQTVNLWDDMTFEEVDSDIIEISSNVAELGSDDSNIVYRACDLLKKTYDVKTGIRIELVKKLPMAAGMAGGSTDAAATLVAANELWGLNLSRAELMELGLKLGADVPYCIMRGTALAEGIGEILTPVRPMPNCFILIAKPPVSVSTASVYKGLRLNELASHPDIDKMLTYIENGDLSGIVACLENVLETVTVPMHPEIGVIKDFMKEHGALGALMSGSGPTVFGIYGDRETAENAKKFIESENLANQVYVTTPFDGKEPGWN